jgi:hypothetical protein
LTTGKLEPTSFKTLIKLFLNSHFLLHLTKIHIVHLPKLDTYLPRSIEDSGLPLTILVMMEDLYGLIVSSQILGSYLDLPGGLAKILKHLMRPRTPLNLNHPSNQSHTYLTNQPTSGGHLVKKYHLKNLGSSQRLHFGQFNINRVLVPKRRRIS